MLTPCQDKWTFLPPLEEEEDEEEAEVLDVYRLEPLMDEISEEEGALRFDTVIQSVDFKKIYTEDDTLALVLQYVRRKEKPNKEERHRLTQEVLTYLDSFDRLSEKEGLLYMASISPFGQVLRLCIPQILENKVLYAGHNAPQAGHSGIINTTRKIAAKYYFPSLMKKVTYWINNCVDCLQKNKTQDVKKHLQYRREICRFGDTLFIDTVGKLTPAKYRNEICAHVLTMLDGATRYLVAVPIPDLKALTIAKYLMNNWVSIHGVPERLHSDNGTSFTGEVFRELMKLLGIKHTRTPAYIPEGNRVERAH